ncbi:MAG: glutamate racemase [Desulfovibrio sp. MES5]|uniref:glutamate racemase n=1 Tax=Desulfovibrio sp. MES5 TaxID=1899016 RepID=UPI000B9CFD02|nr:glutamate racemase [Desulfovibrio sp. MES5]OXS30023.1 MAG: glutamate racemase [Desulfovibrio sp. MES5]
MNSNSRLPIGLFDSGMGGLTVFKALAKRLPGEDLLYLGDTARLPYGTKGRDTIIRYTLSAAQKLVDMGVKMLVVACNTATAAALPALREHFAPLPVLGVVEPGSQAAAEASRNGRIVVLATEATINGGAYQQAIARIRPDAVVLTRACNLFVSLAEEGWMNGPLVEGIIRRYLEGLFDAPDNKAADDAALLPDTLVLGCTHYPLLQDALRQVVGPDVHIVDSAATTAEFVAQELNTLHLLHPDRAAAASDAAGKRQGESRFLTTDHVTRFIRTGSLFLGRDMTEDEVTLVDL